jgi:hypothetical protein
VAELVDARDLKSPATTESAAIFCKTAENRPAVSAVHPLILQNVSEAHFVALAFEPMTRIMRTRPPPAGGIKARPHDYDKSVPGRASLPSPDANAIAQVGNQTPRQICEVSLD